MLLPEVRDATDDTLIVADGFSCQEQIEQQTDRAALHLAQVLQLAKQGEGAMEGRPETKMLAERKRAQNWGMARAGLTIGLAVIAATLATRWAAKRRVLTTDCAG